MFDIKLFIMTINKKDIRFIKYQLKGDNPKANKELEVTIFQ